MKKYWLTIHPDTFIWVKSGIICVYNAENNAFLRDFSSRELKKIIDELQEVGNLYTATITEMDLELSTVESWIRKLIENDCCDWVADDGNNQKTVSLKPVLKITDDMEYYKDCHSRGQNVNLLSNLHRLIIYLNGSEYGNDIYARQCIYPFKQQSDLDWKELYNFMVSSGIPIALSEIVFVGCFWKYKEYEKVLDFLNLLSAKVSVYCTEQDYCNYIEEREAPNLLEEYILYILKEQYPEDDSVFDQLAGHGNLIWHFILTSEEDYIAANNLVEKYRVGKYRLFPVYNGNNRKFFEDFIYTSEDEILDYKPTKREIFVNQTLNTNYFGSLHILPGGDISGGNKVIGNLTDSLYDVVYREMTEGDSWFHIRNQRPCCDCCYQWLCPSPSNYESALNKSNLCNIVE